MFPKHDPPQKMPRRRSRRSPRRSKRSRRSTRARRTRRSRSASGRRYRSTAARSSSVDTPNTVLTVTITSSPLERRAPSNREAGILNTCTVLEARKRHEQDNSKVERIEAELQTLKTELHVDPNTFSCFDYYFYDVELKFETVNVDGNHQPYNVEDEYMQYFSKGLAVMYILGKVLNDAAKTNQLNPLQTGTVTLMSKPFYVNPDDVWHKRTYRCLDAENRAILLNMQVEAQSTIRNAQKTVKTLQSDIPGESPFTDGMRLWVLDIINQFQKQHTVTQGSMKIVTVKPEHEQVKGTEQYATEFENMLKRFKNEMHVTQQSSPKRQKS